MASPDSNSSRSDLSCITLEVPGFSRSIKGPPALRYRSRIARDLACILDVNPAIMAWECRSRPLTAGDAEHQADFTAYDIDGVIWLIDAPDRKSIVDKSVLTTCAEALGLRYRQVERSEIYDGFRLRNATDLLRYSGHKVSLGDRVRLLAALDENGSLSFAECMQIVRESQSVAVLASLILQSIIEVDLDEALIGPETKVTRMRA